MPITPMSQTHNIINPQRLSGLLWGQIIKLLGQKKHEIQKWPNEAKRVTLITLTTSEFLMKSVSLKLAYGLTAVVRNANVAEDDTMSFILPPPDQLQI